MVVKKIICSLMIFFCIGLSSYAENEKKLLIDEAGVLSQENFTKIEKYLQAVSRKSKSDAVIVIVSSTGEKSPQDYADDYFDYNGYGQGSEYEGSLLLIVTGDGSQGSRYAHISTHGKKTISTLTDNNIEKLLDSLIYGGLKENDYLSGIESYLKTLGRRFYNSLSLLEVAMSLGLAALVFLFKFFGTQKKYKNKEAFAFAPFYDVNKNSLVSFATVDDVFLSTNTVSQIIAKSDGGSKSGGSSTHTSSSGRTHGGGGRSF
ncbi:TPM domain-containing protein [Treponema sp. OMZ 792]|uniref:TPM domain-containing protein n=1 Tax=unclassified Treponema TaxID=2638727 RepID=UPI0020A44570|nr:MULTISPECIES: TPM domain-containing protein [unclassified Treponema]UTC74443.1 TPM domain-containing protein [Treponema sp. OMZ 792]UTC80840.1 TPM domain-containing protein [Treponema sp. OMZ 798]